MSTKRIYIILIFISYTSFLLGQEYITSIRHYNFEKGLETRDIRSTIKDSQGFLWFTTKLGAYRFDGYEFKNYRREIKGNEPFSMHQLIEDAQRNIWFGHTNSSAIYDDISILPFGKDSLVAFNQFFKNSLPFTTDKLIRTIFKPPHSIFLIYENGQVYEYSNKTFTKIYENKSVVYGKEWYVDIEKTNDQKYLICTQDRLIILAPDKTIIKKEVMPKSFLKINNGQKGQIWFYTESSFFLKENIDSPIKPAPFQEKIPESSFPFQCSGFNNGAFIFADGTSNYDLSLVNLNDNSIIDIEPFGTDQVNFSPHSYFIEHPNSIWLNTHDGIYHIQLRKKVFNNYLPATSTRRMIKGNNNDLWVTSSKGFHKINLKEKTTETDTIESRIFGKDMFWENSNEIWLIKARPIVQKINLVENKTIKSYDLFDKWSQGTFANFIHRNKKSSHLWLGTSAGLFRYDEDKDDFYFFHHEENFSQFDSIQSLDLFEFENFNLIATSVGIFEFDMEKGFTKHFSTKNNTLPYDNIVHIHQDKKDGTFWVGTKLGGLIHWDKKNNTFKTFTTEDGLSNNLIYAVYEDDDGFLWLSSNIGLMRFNKKTEEVITFTTDDGLPYDEFNYNSHLQDEEGNLYFGGLNGITTFHPNNIPKIKENSPLKITNIEVLDSKKGKMISRWENFKENKSIELSPSEKHFQLTIALLDYQKPIANQYQYKIEGYNNEWKVVEGNVINIHELPSGDFNVFIKAKNPHDYWSDEILNIPVSVQKPIYIRWWFILSSILLFIALVNLFIRRRTANLISKTEELEKEVARRTEELLKDKEIIEKQAEDLQKLDTLKTQFFGNVTHELRTPLALIIGPLKHLMNTKELDNEMLRSLTAIAQNGEKLKELIEEILDLSRYDLNKLKLNKQPVHFLTEIRNWAAGFDIEAQQRDIDFQLFYQLPIDIHLNLDSRKIQKIVTNLLTNAFKFTPSGGRIELNILEHENKIHINLIDTGEGISEEELPKIFDRFYQSKQNKNQHGGLGIGLALSKDLSQLMNGTLTVASTKGKGSTFTFKFPKEESAEKVAQQKEIETLLAEVSQTTIPFDNNKNTVLIVEDNIQMQRFIQDLLIPHVNTIIASNGIRALQILEEKNHKIDLIVSDIMMSEMDGFTLLEKLKADEQFQFIPIIILTAITNNINKIKAITFGVDDYLTKPFDPEELTTRVNNLLENVKLRKEAAMVEPKSNGNDSDEIILAPLESADLKWLKQLEVLAFEKATTPNFNIGQLAHEMAIGERQLNRKVKKITGLTPGAYLKEIKLQKARQLLENKAFDTVAEISYLIGFSSTQYFSKLFKARFGKLPSDYLKY